MTEDRERLYLDDLAVGQRFASGGAETVRERGAADCRDRSSRPRRPPWKVSGEGRAVVCAPGRATRAAYRSTTPRSRSDPPCRT